MVVVVAVVFVQFDLWARTISSQHWGYFPVFVVMFFLLGAIGGLALGGTAYLFNRLLGLLGVALHWLVAGLCAGLFWVGWTRLQSWSVFWGTWLMWADLIVGLVLPFATLLLRPPGAETRTNDVSRP
ncbi:hypothetical protein ASF88_19905 [Leifsonia sp. Leaf336]|uniref:hypothetical protein n=1 Tax=Leifsonia sp. Leaf336 TaxID=1736341 RepID=UPI0006F377D2|nr:hypothetical protein [Leifsonia sp. Leaf336]KQR51419.1 hypothetical protein ASF88_19905 [Leifsonia sp. Leaf336]